VRCQCKPRSDFRLTVWTQQIELASRRSWSASSAENLLASVTLLHSGCIGPPGVAGRVLAVGRSGEYAAESIREPTTAPTLTKPRLLSATQSPQSERHDTRRPTAVCRSAFQSVGRVLRETTTSGERTHTGELDRTHCNPTVSNVALKPVELFMHPPPTAGSNESACFAVARPT
jgi:hypothetical protein